MKSFEELACWQEGANLRRAISGIVQSFPAEEKYGLSSQMLRSSRSVTNNIAEGFGRYHFKENMQFCRQARGSLFEVIDHLLIAEEEKYIDAKTSNNLISQAKLCIKILNGYIKYLGSTGNNRVLEEQELYLSDTPNNLITE